MILTSDQVADYDQDGYLLVPDLFAPPEVAAMLREVEGGERVAAHVRDAADATGKAAKLALWGDIGPDIWGAATTAPRLVNAIQTLMRDQAVFFHGKVMLKVAHSGGAWEWHQDYGYRYGNGYVYPRLMSAFVALDPATRENGCLQVLRGSHKMGRLTHGQIAGQTGADMSRIHQLEPLFERVHCEMSPGSVLFFDCNLLHASAANESDHDRRAFIVCYNALSNPQLTPDGVADQKPCPIGTADAIQQFS